jgi:D-alanyl-D-alanine carboxypeptidase
MLFLYPLEMAHNPFVSDLVSGRRPFRSDRSIALLALLLAILVVLPLVLIVRQVSHTPSVAAADLQRHPVTQRVSPSLVVLHDNYSFSVHAPIAAPPFPAIAAASGILIDTDTNTILWQQNPHASLAPASTTKILTALVVLENFREDRTVTITPDALNQAWDETKLGLQPGQTLTVRQLMYAMLMISANDAATALATDTVGMPEFVNGMNAQAAALGLKDSHFVHPVGLDDPGEKSSAYDLAVLGLTAYDNFALFRTIVGTHEYTIDGNATHPPYTFDNIDLLLSTYPGTLGIKPGFTGDAGYCLVAMSNRNGHRLLSVLMNATPVYKQSGELLDWGFQTLGIPPALQH